MASQINVYPSEHKALLKLIDEFAQFGRTADGGVHRLAASAEDGAVRDYLTTWFAQNGFTTAIDPVGNMFGVLKLGSGDLNRYFMSGSHLDSQPTGGRFDGALGVAFACITALVTKRLVSSGELSTSFGHFVVAAWTNEEGARFHPSMLGSRVYTQNLTLDEALNAKDKEGVCLGQALESIGYRGHEIAPKADHYLEVHIEQGTKLETAKIPVGIVSTCWGARKLRVRIEGRADHTGPTPMSDRQDALWAAAKLINDVHTVAKEATGVLHGSVGRMTISPNSPNTVADCTELWVEFRGADEADLTVAEQRFTTSIGPIAEETRCTIEISEREVRHAIPFDAASIALVSQSFDQAGIKHMLCETIAGHDAVALQSVCPSTLLFVPSHQGATHSPREFTSDEDIRVGFDASMQAVGALVPRPVVQSSPGENHA